MRKQLDSLLLGGSGSLLLGLLLQGGLGELAGVEREVRAADIADGLDVARAGHDADEGAGSRSINLELFHDDGARDAENLGQFRADLVESLLVEEHIVVELVLDLGLGPGLLLSLSSLGLLGLRTLRGGLPLIFGRLLCFSLHRHKHSPR